MQKITRKLGQLVMVMMMVSSSYRICASCNVNHALHTWLVPVLAPVCVCVCTYCLLPTVHAAQEKLTPPSHASESTAAVSCVDFLTCHTTKSFCLISVDHFQT